MVLGFHGITLPTMKKHFEQMNRLENVNGSFSAYSAMSPGYKPDSPKFLVKHIACLDIGSVFHSLNGYIIAQPYGEYTLGMILTMLLAEIEQIPPVSVNVIRYFNFDMIENPDDWFVHGGLWL